MSEQESVVNKVIAVVSNSSRPFGDFESAAGSALMSPFVLPSRSDPILTRARDRVRFPWLTMMKLCQPVVNNQRSALPKLHADYSQLADILKPTSTFQLRPRKEGESVTNALMAKAILALSSSNLRHLGQLSAFCQLIMQISTTNATRKCRKQFTERDEQHLSMRIGSVY